MDALDRKLVIADGDTWFKRVCCPPPGVRFVGQLEVILGHAEWNPAPSGPGLLAEHVDGEGQVLVAVEECSFRTDLAGASARAASA
jgi:hypothetical protein